MVVGDGTPGPGRPSGVPNKLTKERILAAAEAFGPINTKALELMRRHLDFHLRMQEGIAQVIEAGNIAEIIMLGMLDEQMARGNCPTCRHIFTLSSEYTYGKPMQRVGVTPELAAATLREFGMDDPTGEDVANIIRFDRKAM